MRALIATTCKPDDRKTLCITRSLSSGGIKVTVGGDRFLGEAFHSRFLNNRIKYPHPKDDIDGFTKALIHNAKRNEYEVLLPTCDYTTIAIAANREKLCEYFRIPIPDYDTLMKTHDKIQAIEIAEQLEIKTPVTYFARNEQDLEEIAGKISYPCIVKLRRGAGGIGLKVPFSKEDLIRSFNDRPFQSDMVYAYERPIIQEYVPGPIHDVCLLFNHGQVRAALTQRRLKMYPSRGGVGIINETTHEPELKEKAVKLLEALRWHGPAQVEFKIDPRDGTAKLIEVNGRFWGTLDLSIQAGMNFPVMAYKMAVEGDVNPVFKYNVGLKYRWPFPFGLLHTIEAKGGIRSAWEFFRPESGTASDIRFSDPLPILAEAMYILRRVLKRRKLFNPNLL